MVEKQLNLAIVGCGAVTELSHLPAVRDVEAVDVTLLVDTNHQRATQFAEQFDVPHVASDYRRMPDYANAVILAVPHHLHAAMAVDLLAKGFHVLVEKPMALTMDECDQMIAASEQSGAVLAVALVRRFYPVSKLVKDLIASGLLGEIRSFDVREGGIYNWPAASDFFFRKEKAGGGVLIDTGAHTLDTLLWWLGDFEAVEYFGDAFGGVEADCELHLVLQSGAKGTVELSRTRQLRNTYQIHGTKRSLEVSVGPSTSLKLWQSDSDETLRYDLTISPQPACTLHQAMCAQLADFADAILSGRAPSVPGVEGRRSVALIQACYSNAKRLTVPWVQVPVVATGSSQESFT